MFKEFWGYTMWSYWAASSLHTLEPNPTPHGGHPTTANTALSVGKQMEPIENSSLSFVLLRNSVRMEKHSANKVVKKRKTEEKKQKKP